MFFVVVVFYSLHTFISGLIGHTISLSLSSFVWRERLCLGVSRCPRVRVFSHDGNDIPFISIHHTAHNVVALTQYRQQQDGRARALAHTSQSVITIVVITRLEYSPILQSPCSERKRLKNQIGTNRNSVVLMYSVRYWHIVCEIASIFGTPAT